MIFGTSAYVNPGERGSEGRAGWASEDGLPDHITRGCDVHAAILQEASRIGSVWGEEYRCSFGTQSLFSCQQKNIVYYRCQMLPGSSYEALVILQGG